jgi:hypothetical protein
VVLAVLAGLLVAADLAVRSAAESQLRQRVIVAAAPGGATTARIESFPFLGRLLTSGQVSHVEVSAGDVTVQGVTFARVAVDLRDVTFDRHRLLSDQKVVVSSLQRGTATAELTAAQLSKLLGVDVTLLAGKAQIRVAGELVTATASVSENVLHLSVSGLSVPALSIPKLPLVPCVADAVILPGRIRLTCSVDQVPPELVGLPLAQLGG